MPNSPRLALPYPTLADTADVPRDILALVNKLDPSATVFVQGLFSARPAAGVAGRFFYATDQGVLWYDNGTTWTGAGSSASGATLSFSIKDVGVVGQYRAGRELTVADFTSLGLSQPIGLWNLSNLTNLGSDARALVNKGAVAFASGINGAASTAAQFTGNTGQALYIVDSGTSDPYRIRTGSWGCWFRTAKRGTNQILLSKAAAAPQFGWQFFVGTANVINAQASADGTNSFVTTGVSDVADDRWHFLACTYDGTTMRAYIDGVLEGVDTRIVGGVLGSTAAFNIGAQGADASTAAANPHFGRVDEAFVTADVLSEDEIRCLYAAKLTHSLGVAPTGVRLNVHRRRKGAALAVADFTTQPLRLYNLTTAGGNTYKDEGSNGINLTYVSGYLTSGVDGKPQEAMGFDGSTGGLAATDAGLPSALAARSYGCWFKTTGTGTSAIMAWGGGPGPGANDARLVVSTGNITSASGGDLAIGPYIADGQWHFAIATDDNTAGDGVRRKLYLDGRLVVGSTVLNSISLQGANRFRIGAGSDGTSPFIGQTDAAFVCGYALTAADVAALYAKGSQDLGASPKNPGDHIERVSATDILFIGDTLESQNTIDLSVVA